MGGWGLALFCSDYDWDIVDEMNGILGVEDDAGLYHSRDVDKQRNLLNSGGLIKLTGHYSPDIDKDDNMMTRQNRAPARYTLVILGALAMSCGADITPDYRNFLAQSYRRVGLLRDSLVQMEDALAKYTNGTPHDLCKILEGRPKTDDRLYPGSMLVNTESPEMGMGWADAMRHMAKEFWAEPFRQQGAAETAHPTDSCGGCGASQKIDGAALQRCGRCLAQRYCSVACQRKHWAKHRVGCKPP